MHFGLFSWNFIEFKSSKLHIPKLIYLLSLRKFIHVKNVTGGVFWIGGIYDRDRWEWADGGLVNESMAP